MEPADLTMRHRFHSLCPYFAVFPESFAAEWIDRLTAPGDTVLDPFSGRGTVPFQALLMGRNAIACDLNPVAYCITRAKTQAPADAATILRRIDELARRFNPDDWEGRRRALPPFFRVAYAPTTLRQVLYLRSRLRWEKSNIDTFIAAIALGALHGESDRGKNYFSNQMPRTIATKPDYSIRFWRDRSKHAPDRDVFAVMRRVVAFRYVTPPPTRTAFVAQSDMRTLPELCPISRGRVKLAITSPPYLDMTRYVEDQWLRLWFLGGEPRPVYKHHGQDDRRTNARGWWKLMAEAWTVIGSMVAPKGHVVFRLGGKNLPIRSIRDGLVAASRKSGRRCELRETQVSEIRRRQTQSFRPNSVGCIYEVDCHFQML
jgi:DNA methylase